MLVLLYTVIFFLNIIAFGLYGLDKHKATYDKWRIPEAILLGLAVVGGAYGAGMGMLLFRHKTKHRTFLVTVPICFAIWMLLLLIICMLNTPTPNML